MTIYDTENGAKPRFDGAGSEFGIMHRDLGPGFLMFDIDRMSAVLEVNLELKRENEGFIEYRQSDDVIRFVAFFEYKARETENSLKALDNTVSSTLARNEMARRLDCRMFVVFGCAGNPPFKFFELDLLSNQYRLIGKLEYTADNRLQAVRDFWWNTLKIKR